MNIGNVDKALLIQQVRQNIWRFSQTQDRNSDVFLQEFRKRDDAWEILFEILTIKFYDNQVVQVCF